VSSGGGAVGGGGAVAGGSWPAVGEATGGEGDAILVGKRGGGAWSAGRRGDRGRRRGGGPREKGRRLAEDGDGPRGEGAGPSRMTAGRSWTWVGHSWRTAGWLEGRRRSGTTAALRGKIWQPDGVVSYLRQT
jgi:hypothetical protein